MRGIDAWAGAASVFILVDVLSFSTAVSVAVDAGASIVPFPHGHSEAAAREAHRRDALLAMPRGAGGGQVSLSPGSIRAAAAGRRILLPSPNGSRLSLATGDTPTFTA